MRARIDITDPVGDNGLTIMGWFNRGITSCPLVCWAGGGLGVEGGVYKGLSMQESGRSIQESDLSVCRKKPTVKPDNTLSVAHPQLSTTATVNGPTPFVICLPLHVALAALLPALAALQPPAPQPAAASADQPQPPAVVAPLPAAPQPTPNPNDAASLPTLCGLAMDVDPAPLDPKDLPFFGRA